MSLSLIFHETKFYFETLKSAYKVPATRTRHTDSSSSGSSSKFCFVYLMWFPGSFRPTLKISQKLQFEFSLLFATGSFSVLIAKTWHLRLIYSDPLPLVSIFIFMTELGPFTLFCTGIKLLVQNLKVNNNSFWKILKFSNV